MEQGTPFRLTPQIALLIFAGILAAAITIAFFFPSFAEFNASRMHVFTMTLTALGTIAVFFFYYGIVQLNQTQQRQAVINQTLNFSHNIMKIGERIHSSVDRIPVFVKSITPLSPCALDVTQEDTYENCIIEQTLAHEIFNEWNTTVLSFGFLDYDSTAFLTIFLQWANSKLLFEQWQRSRYNYIKETAEFGDLIFKYGLAVTDLTAEGFQKASQALLDDPKFQDIVNRRPVVYA